MGEVVNGALRSARFRFACYTPADPPAVWSTLTGPCGSRTFLYGMHARSSWRPEAPIDFELAGRPVLSGEVLYADPPRRLSYVLRSSPEDPAVYVTWSLRARPGGTTIALEVDEVAGSDQEEAENAWLPILADLQRRLG